MRSAFHKISRVRSILDGTTWYLSEDCLLAAKRTMYAVEYRRFYLRDLEWIVVWPNRSWLLRMIIPGALFAVAGACFWRWVNSTSGVLFAAIGLAWVLLELALGPTAGSRVRTTGLSVDLPLVKRTRRARKVLKAIDAAVRACRDIIVQPVVPTPGPEQAITSLQTNSGAGSAAPSMSDAS